MSLLTQDKIKQLRTQLNQFEDPRTADVCKIAILRLESQLPPPEPNIPKLHPTEELLQSLVKLGTVKIYHPFN